MYDFLKRFLKFTSLFIGAASSVHAASIRVSWYDWEIPEGGTEEVFGLSSSVQGSGNPDTFRPLPSGMSLKHIDGADGYFTRRESSGETFFLKRNLETGVETPLFTLPDRPTVWNFQFKEGRVYYADSLFDKVWSFNLDGSDGVILYTGGSGAGPTYSTLSGSHLFWSEFSANVTGVGAIVGIDLENSAEIINLASGLTRPQGIASTDEHVFWFDSGERTIYRSDYLGEEIVPIVPSAWSRFGGFAVDDEYLYWAENTQLKRSDHDGGNIVVLDTTDRLFSSIFLETIPEPSSFALSGLGFLFLLRRRR